MFRCSKCETTFRDIFNLTRHQARLRPCVNVYIKVFEDTSKEECKIDTSPLKIDISPLKIDISSLKIDTSKNKINTLICTSLEKDSIISENSCQYCFNVFSTKNYKNRHEQICKQQDDPIRLLELKKNICPVLPDSKTECRFCNKNLSRISTLNIHFDTCKKRKEYHKNLLKQNKKVINNINNCNTNNTNNGNITNNNNTNNTNNINNGTVNNIHINVLGQETTDHIETESIINLLRDIRKEFGENQASLMAGTFIDSFDKYIRELPENQNIVIPHHKSIFGTIQTDQGWKRMSADRCLNRAFKNSAKELYTHKEAIDNHNELVFKSLTNKQIFSEVKQFGITGLEGNSDDLRQIKTSFKIGKLKEIDF